MTGMMLSYLIHNFLIDRYQYEQWRALGCDELKEQLETAGIMNSNEFDTFSRQLAAYAEMYGAQNQADY